MQLWTTTFLCLNFAWIPQSNRSLAILYILTHYVIKYPHFLLMLGLSDVESIARHRIDEGGRDISSWNLDELLLDVIWMR